MHRTEQLHQRMGSEAQRQHLDAVCEGDSVHVGSLGHDAVVLQVDSKQGKARVRAGNIELDVSLEELSAPAKQGKVKARKPSQDSWKADVAENNQHELKLIGLRVEEALELLEPFLNQTSLGGLREVRIIHGVGTGRLRDAVREHLARHPLVEEFQPGGPHEGRDGATVVTLRN